MDVYDFVALPAIEPHDVARAVEMVCPDLTVYGRGPGATKRVLGQSGFEQIVTLPNDHDPAKQGWVSGAVWTSVRPDGSLYIALGTYAQSCQNPDCTAGHGPRMQIRQGRPLTKGEQLAVKGLVGESDDWPLGVGYDVEVLSGLGFTPVDAPLCDIPVRAVDVYRALSVLLHSSPSTWLSRVVQLDQIGFEVEFDKLGPKAYETLREHGVTVKPEFAMSS